MIVLLELMLALGLFSLLVSSWLMLEGVFEMRREIYREEQRIEKVKQAFVKTFSYVVDHIIRVCSDGIATAECSNTYPFPSSMTNSGRNLILTYPVNLLIPNRSLLVSELTSIWEDAECSVQDSAGNLTITCPNFNLSSTYTSPALIDPYANLSFTLESIKLGLDGSEIRKSFTVDFSDEFLYRRRGNERKFAMLSDVLKEYHLRQRVEEANNPCTVGGGLHSFDDVKIPWIMKGYTSTPYQLCNTSTGTACSCTNIDWSTVNQSDRNAMRTLLTNLLVGPLLVDYFGNPVYVYALVDSSDNPISPPNPQPNYTLSPPYTGLIRLSTSFSCVASRQKGCYLKFVYPN